MAPGVIQHALGGAWDGLAPLVRRHFDVGSDGGELVLCGAMDITHGGPGRLVFPLLGMLGVLVPFQGRGIPCRVRHRMERGWFVWDREFDRPGFYRPAFYRPGQATYRFCSRMMPAGNGCCVERMRFGFAIRMRVSCRDRALVFEDDGYCWGTGRWRLPLRLRWLLGALRVEESQDGDELVVRLTLQHPWFGRMFDYRGRFAFPGARERSRSGGRSHKQGHHHGAQC